MADRLHDRLKDARIRAGFKSAAAAARAHGWTESAYRHHENGTRGFDMETAITYANAYKANARYLFGLDPAFDTAGVSELFNNVFDPTPDVARRSLFIRVLRSMFGIELVSEIDPSREHGIGHPLVFENEKYHAFNRAFLDSIDPLLTEGNASVLVMVGNTMGETAPNGSMLLLDTRSMLRDWPEAIWAIYSPEGVFVRRVRIDGEKLVLTSDNPDVATECVDRTDFGVIGRVRWIGKTI